MNLPALKTSLPWHYNESSKPEFNTTTSLTKKNLKNKKTKPQNKPTKKTPNKNMSKQKNSKQNKKNQTKNQGKKKICNAHTTTYNSYNIRESLTNIFLAH